MTNRPGTQHSLRVYQAQRMVSAQAVCSPEDALAIMRDTAVATGETLDVVADEVVSRRVTFQPPR